MIDKRKRLLILIEELKLPIIPNQGIAYVEKLSNDDVGFLLQEYERVKKLQNQIEKEVSEIDPEGFAKIEDEYQKKLLELEDEYLSRRQKEDEEVDNKLEEVQRDVQKQSEGIISQYKQESDRFSVSYQNFLSKLNSSMSGE